MSRAGFGALSLITLALMVPSATAQTYTITTYAGGPPPAVRPGTRAVDQPLNSPTAVAAGANGVFYVSSGSDHRVYRVARDGTVVVLAGTGTPGFSREGGLATLAEINSPGAIALDTKGNLFFVDAGNSRVRKISPSGFITTVAGTGSSSGVIGDGERATATSLSYPRGIALDQAGNLFIVTINSIRKVTPAGIITTVTTGRILNPNGGFGFGSPLRSDLAIDAAGNLYFADTSGSRVLKVTPAGIVSTAVDDKTVLSPQSVALDAQGNLFVADIGIGQTGMVAPRVRKITPAGAVSIVAGSGIWGFSGDGGPAMAATLRRPGGIAVDGSGNLYIADSENHRIRKVTSRGVISTVMGNGTHNFSGDGGPATSAQLNGPYSVALDAAGNLFIADTWNARIRKISTTGITTTVAGTGTPDLFMPRSTGDGGPATSAEITAVDVAVDATGNVFIAGDDRVRKVAPDGVITTVAGPGSTGPGDIGDGGPATSARMFPRGVAVDGAGNLFIADAFHNRIRKVMPNGIISTVAGDGNAGFTGDGGPATAAQFKNPGGVAVDAEGNLFIADTDNNRIRKITNGIINTVAGREAFGPPGEDGPAVSVYLSFPRAITVDRDGNLFIAIDMRIRKVSKDGNIRTVAGNGKVGYSGDGGEATAASLNYPTKIAVDAAGNLFVADASNNRIRKLTPRP